MVRCVVLLLSFFVATLPLRAHETWLLPATFSSVPERTVAIDLTSGMQFPESEHAIHPDRVQRARFRLGGESVDMKDFNRLDTCLRFTPSFPRAGLATVWVELHPRAIELTEEKVAEYLDEIGAAASVRATWAKVKGSEVWKETYTKHAKTWVAVGGGAVDRSWQEPVGMAFELVPLTDPIGLQVGQKASFRLLRGGKPFPGATVGLLTEGAKDRILHTTDEDGQVAFRIERAGKLLVFAVDLRRTKAGDGWESDFTTVTLPVKSER